ncbi:MAG TPA: HEAT repeat domain-containing protein [Nitrospiraceae bacterium]
MIFQRRFSCRSLLSYFAWIAIWLALDGCYPEGPPVAPERAIRSLTELLHDPHSEVRRAAAESLGKIGDPKTAAALLGVLSDQEPRVRAAAALAIGRLGPSGGEKAAQAVVEALDDHDELVQRAAVIAISELEPAPRVLASVAKFLSAKEVSTRRSVTQALSMIDARPWLPDLVKVLQDGDAEVRQNAVVALAELGDPNIAPLLRDRLIRDPSAAVRSEAAFRLGKIADPDTIKVLAASANQDRDPVVRRWAQGGLDNVRSSSGSDSMR